MKATFPNLSATLGDPLASISASSCVPTQTAASAIRLEPSQHSEPSEEQSRRSTQSTTPTCKSNKPVVTSRPPRFSSGNGITVMPASLSQRQGQWTSISGQQHNGLSLSRLECQSEEKTQELPYLPGLDSLWTVSIAISEHFLPLEKVSLSTNAGVDSERNGVAHLLANWTSLLQNVSISVALDLVLIFIRMGVPKKCVERELHRAWRLWQRSKYTSALTAVPVRRRLKEKRRQSRSLAPRQSGITIRGIRNYGQTCFLNSVLQALASLDPFLEYLDRIVSLYQERVDFGTVDSSDCLSKRLHEFLLSLNGASLSQSDPREILYRVGEKHVQFCSHHRANVGTEQQDAQELLQALLDIVISDAQLDSICSLESSFVSSLADEELGESSNDYLSLTELLVKMGKEQTSRLVDSGRREEKKQEDVDPLMNGDTCEKETLEKRTPSAMELFPFQTFSPVTPSPLSGWIGSTLQCCNCEHVRPIQNAPFLEVPVIPTSVSLYLSSSKRSAGHSPSARLPACSLAQCLKEFTSVERVHEVECRRCTIKQEVIQLEEEVEMLQGAIDTVLRRKGAGSACEGQGEGLRSELNKAKTRLHMLLNSDPDDMDEMSFFDSEALLGVDQTAKTWRRGDAKKCLFLTRLPSILCLHVQRRYYDPATDRVAKTMQHVDFPEILDLVPYCAYGGRSLEGVSWAGSGSSITGKDQSPSKPILYKLTSIIEHRGNAFSGHYQTYRKVRTGNLDKWFLVSDELVVPINWTEVRKCQAYMLFYEAL